MTPLRLLAVTLLALALACATNRPALASILIQIDKPSQTMTVSVDGAVRYRWYVSTGATGFSTPAGTYKPFRMEVMHYSQEWDNAGMPHSIFFTSRGHAVHGSNHPGLGTPVSHGCVRLTLTNASTLYQLVGARGMGETTVIVKRARSGRPVCPEQGAATEAEGFLPLRGAVRRFALASDGVQFAMITPNISGYSWVRRRNCMGGSSDACAPIYYCCCDRIVADRLRVCGLNRGSCRPTSGQS